MPLRQPISALSLSLPRNARAPVRPRVLPRNRELLLREHSRRRALAILNRRQSIRRTQGKSRARGRRGGAKRAIDWLVFFFLQREREQQQKQNALIQKRHYFLSLSRVKQTDLRGQRGPSERRQRLRSSTGARRRCRGQRPSWRGGGRGKRRKEEKRERESCSQQKFVEEERKKILPSLSLLLSSLHSQKKIKKTFSQVSCLLFLRALARPPPLFSRASESSRSGSSGLTCDPPRALPREQQRQQEEGPRSPRLLRDAVRRRKRRLGYRRRCSSPLLGARIRPLCVPIAQRIPRVGLPECSQQLPGPEAEQQRHQSPRSRTHPRFAAAEQTGQQRSGRRGRGREGRMSSALGRHPLPSPTPRPPPPRRRPLRPRLLPRRRAEAAAAAETSPRARRRALSPPSLWGHRFRLGATAAILRRRRRPRRRPPRPPSSTKDETSSTATTSTRSPRGPRCSSAGSVTPRRSSARSPSPSTSS